MGEILDQKCLVVGNRTANFVDAECVQLSDSRQQSVTGEMKYEEDNFGICLPAHFSLQQ